MRKTRIDEVPQCINVFRCDKIISISENKDIEAIEIQNTDGFIQDNMRQKDAIEFEIAITKKGVDIFIKEKAVLNTLIDASHEDETVKAADAKNKTAAKTNNFKNMAKT